MSVLSKISPEEEAFKSRCVISRIGYFISVSWTEDPYFHYPNSIEVENWYSVQVTSAYVSSHSSNLEAISYPLINSPNP